MIAYKNYDIFAVGKINFNQFLFQMKFKLID